MHWWRGFRAIRSEQFIVSIQSAVNGGGIVLSVSTGNVFEVQHRQVGLKCHKSCEDQRDSSVAFTEWMDQDKVILASCNISYLFNTPPNFANLLSPRMSHYIERESVCDLTPCEMSKETFSDSYLKRSDPGYQTLNATLTMALIRCKSYYNNSKSRLGVGGVKLRQPKTRQGKNSR